MANAYQFLENMRIHLGNKGYAELVPPQPLELAMIKQTFGGTLPKVVGVVIANTDGPQLTFQRVQGWFRGLLGHSGSGVLLFVYQMPSAQDVNIISQFSGQVVAGTYALSSNQYWMSNYMGWDTELFR